MRYYLADCYLSSLDVSTDTPPADAVGLDRHILPAVRFSLRGLAGSQSNTELE